MDTKTAAESKNWELVHTWSRDTDLDLFGLGFGEIIAYDLLRILGAIWLAAGVSDD